MANDFNELEFLGIEEQAAPSPVREDRDREHGLDAIAREAAIQEAARANVARTDPYASEALYQSGMLAPEFPSGPLAPEPLLPVREQQRIHPFGLGDKAGIQIPDEETKRIYDYINFQREYDPSGERLLYSGVELDPAFHLANLRGTLPPKEGVVIGQAPWVDSGKEFIGGTGGTSGGLSELAGDQPGRQIDWNVPIIRPPAEPPKQFAPGESYMAVKGDDWRSIASQKDFVGYGPDGRLFHMPNDLNETMGRASSDEITEHGEYTGLASPAEWKSWQGRGIDPKVNIGGADPYISNTLSPWQQYTTSPIPSPLVDKYNIDRTRQNLDRTRETLDRQGFFNPGTWGIQGGPVGSERELDAREAPGGPAPVWTGSGGLSNLVDSVKGWGGPSWASLLAALGMGLTGATGFGLPLAAGIAAKKLMPATFGRGILQGTNIYKEPDSEDFDSEGEEIPWWKRWLSEKGNQIFREDKAQGGLISLAHGGNPSVQEAGNNIKNLLATKMGYEGNKYSGVPNQQGMINTVNQGIGDNVKSGLRSIVANAYAQGNVPPPVTQYSQPQLLNRGLTMLPNTANTPVPQQLQQPSAQGNISNVYAQSTLPQSHYMQPNQVT